MKQYLPHILPDIYPWLSDQDITPGSRWSQELARELHECTCGIICVTQENMNSPWINFEAGVLSSSIGTEMVIPLLIDIDTDDLSGPLQQFHALKLSRDALEEIVKTMRERIPSPLAEDFSREGLELVWPMFETLSKMTASGAKKTAKPPTKKELIEQIDHVVHRVDGRIEELQMDVFDIISKLRAEPATVDTYRQWQKHEAIVKRLAGHWLQYIPRRLPIECQFSVARFNVNSIGKHYYSGTNYHANGEQNYKFESMKVLPPVRYDDSTLFFYYIYRRSANPMYEGKYGFGKAIAERQGELEDSYEFTRGFFFNEAPGEGYFPLCLKRLQDVARICGVDMDEPGPKDDKLAMIFRFLADKDIPSKWKLFGDGLVWSNESDLD